MKLTKGLSIAFFLSVPLTSQASNPCNCIGDARPGGACDARPGGAADPRPGGAADARPGGALDARPGGPCDSRPGGGATCPAVCSQ